MRRKRAALFVLLLLALLVGGAGLWVRAQQRQYRLNRQLIAALVKGDDKRALVLVEAGADPNTRYNPSPSPSLPELINQVLHCSRSPADNSPTALMIACGAYWNDEAASAYVQDYRPDAPQLVLIMLRHGANIETQGKWGWTPLMQAAFNNRPKTVKVLLEHGANVNARDEDGGTPLMEALEYPDVIHLMLEHGASVNAQDNDGRTPLFLAEYGSVGTTPMRVLLMHGANPNQGAHDGQTPLSLAQDGGHPEVAVLLKQYGAKK